MRNCKENGNVLVYILIAVALLAALTYAVSDNTRGSQQNQLSTARIKLLASELISHANSASIVVQQMESFGINYDEMRFDLPGTAGYSTNITEQIYHPSGGGLQVFQEGEKYFGTGSTRGWRWQGNVNVEWTSTSGTDLILTFLDVNANDGELCSEINNQLHGSTTIPAATVNYLITFQETATDNDFIVAECAACENIQSMCIFNGTNHAFYHIVGAR